MLAVMKQASSGYLSLIFLGKTKLLLARQSNKILERPSLTHHRLYPEEFYSYMGFEIKVLSYNKGGDSRAPP